MCPAPPRGGSGREGVVWIVLVNVSLYALCYQFQRPIEPFLVKKLGANDAEYGRLQSFFSLVQSIGSPIVGYWLDRIGARYMFVVVFLSSACSYALLARATSLAWLYASKVPTMLQAGFLVAQALVASSTRNDNERAAALGKLTTAYTVGATVGPALGGVLGASGDYYLGARLAVAGSVLSACLALMLPEAIQKKKEEKKQLTGVFNVVKRNSVWPLLATKTMTGVTNSAIGVAVPLILSKQYFDEKALGFTMSANAFAVATVAAFGVGPLAKAFGNSRNLARSALAAKVPLIALIGISLKVAGPASLAAASALHACVSHVMATALTTSTTGSVANDEQGSLLGVEHALFAIARIFGPTIGTTILEAGGGESGGFLLLALVAASIDFCTLLFAAATFGNAGLGQKNNNNATAQRRSSP